MSKSHVAAVILAAGSSSRFGRPKQLLDWDGRPLILSAVDTAWAAGLNPVIVVLGAFADEIEPVLSSRPIQIQRNYHWTEGISSSIRTGASALPGDVDAAVFIPGDQPLLKSGFLQDLVHRYAETGKSIVIPRDVEGQRGNPVLFDRKFFSELSHLSGDAGGRRLFDKYPDEITYQPVTDASVLMDVDTPEAYTMLQDYKANLPKLDLTNIQGIICDMDPINALAEKHGLPAFKSQERMHGFCVQPCLARSEEGVSCILG